MQAIHFIERENVNNLTLVCKERDEWESGFWRVARQKAFELIDCQLFLHRSRKEPAFFGGIIIGFYCFDTQGTEKTKERIVFRVKQVSELKGTITSQDGWGQEQKTVY